MECPIILLPPILSRDGILFWDDLFMDSDAMQFSSTGKIDLVKNEIDDIIGIHPLHTIDKIVSKIPIAGWLVTDDKGNLITVHFKVEGKLDDPKVNLIPVQSIAKGTGYVPAAFSTAGKTYSRIPKT